MIGVNDYIEASTEGPILKESEFDLRYSRKVRELASDFGVEYSPDEVVPDDETANSIFEAGVELLASVGLYNKDSRRVIELSKKQVMEIAGSRLHSITFGSGFDAVTIKERRPSDSFPPVLWLGPVCPLTEETYVSACLSFLKIPENQGILGGFLIAAEGFENKSGYPHELIVTAKEIVLNKEAIRRAGRPGLFHCVAASAVTPAANFNVFGPGVCCPQTGSIPIQIMPELKINWDKLTLAIFCQQHGIHPFTDGMGVIGGYARNPGESAITLVANILANWGFSHASTAVAWSTDMKGHWTAKKPILWTNSAVVKALDLNVGNPMYSFGTALAGPMTEMALLESAAYSVAYPAAGIELILGGTCGNGADVDYTAGLHGQMVVDVTKVASGLPRDEANEIVNKIVSRYDDKYDNPPRGVTYQECYDTVKVEPRPEFVALYDKVKDDLGGMGIPFS
jgi:methylamine--corrinoid protein Co-methyltransferase